MEILDLYDINRIRTGETISRDERCPEGRYRLVVHVCIFHPDGRILIQHRQPFVIGWADRWDISVGGCATTGDTSQTAAHRELLEELGLNVDFSDKRPAFTINFWEGFDDFYTLTMDVDLADIRLQPEEVKEVRWATLDEILTMIRNETFIPYDEGLIQYLAFCKDHRGNWDDTLEW